MPNEINEADLKRDFEEFGRKMRYKWYFRSEIADDFSEIPGFRSKSTWKPPLDIQVFYLSSLENYFF